MSYPVGWGTEILGVAASGYAADDDLTGERVSRQRAGAIGWGRGERHDVSGGTRAATLTAPMRALLAFLLSLVVVVLVPFADLGLWVQRELVGTSSFVRLGEDVLQQPAVRAALAERIVAELEQRVPGLAAQDATVRSIVDQVLRDPGLRPVLDNALASTHDQLRNGHDPLELDLNPLLPLVRQQLPAALAARVPVSETLNPVIVLRRRDAPVLWEGVQLVQGGALAVPLLALALLAAAVLAARRRGALCITLGASITLISLGVLALVKPGRSLLEHQVGDPTQRAAFHAGYDTVLRSFVQQTIVMALAGIVLAVIGGVLVWQHDRNRRPTGWA